MTTAYPYLKSTTKEYLGSPNDYTVIPPEATTIAPPTYTTGNIPIFDDVANTWSLVSDFRGREYLNLSDYSIGIITEINTPFPPNSTTNFNQDDFNEISGIPNKNLLVDSDFKFWTEGTTITAINEYRYITGGFSYERQNNTTGVTVSRQNGFDNSRYSLRVQRDVGNTSTDNIRIGQILSVDEAIHYGNKPITLSFTVKKGANYSANNNEFISKIITSDVTENEGGNLGDFSAGSATNSKTHILIDEFRYRHSITLPTNTKQIKVVLEYAPTATALINDYFEITNIKLENSEFATPYIFDDLATAQDKLDEYYLSSYDNGVGKGTVTDVGQHEFHVHGNITNNLFAFENIRFNFPRLPTATVYNPANGNSNEISVRANDGTITTASGTFRHVSSRNASPCYNQAPTLLNESKAFYHFVIDSRL